MEHTTRSIEGSRVPGRAIKTSVRSSARAADELGGKSPGNEPGGVVWWPRRCALGISERREKSFDPLEAGDLRSSARAMICLMADLG